MNTFELMTEMYTKSYSLKEAAILCTTHNNKDIFLAYAKEANATVKQANEIWKSVAPAKSKSPKNRDLFADFLVSAERTEKEAYDFIIKQGCEMGSLNILAHMTSSLSRWSLGDRIRGNSGEITYKGITRKQAQEIMDCYIVDANFEEEHVETEHERLVREAYEHIAEQMAQPASKRNRNSLHPDKVSHLADDDLTSAYTEAFKATPKARRAKKASA